MSRILPKPAKRHAIHQCKQKTVLTDPTLEHIYTLNVVYIDVEIDHLFRLVFEIY